MVRTCDKVSMIVWIQLKWEELLMNSLSSKSLFLRDSILFCVHYHHHRHENKKRYRVTAHHAEFIDVPIRKVGLVQDCNLQGGCHRG